jgi:hypothetical protein
MENSIRLEDLFTLNSHIQAKEKKDYILFILYFPFGILLIVLRFFVVIFGIFAALIFNSCLSPKMIKLYLLFIGIHVKTKNFKKNYNNIKISNLYFYNSL